jgi:hypothetical protein
MTLITRAAALLLVTLVLFLAVEGLSSTILNGFYAFDLRRESQRVPTQHDRELGWTVRPDLFVPDLYGPGMWARTNARGFRSDRPTSASVPEGRIRVICSGDSFTFGWGVSNDTTWCHRLEEINPAIEAVNMGVNGYGIDQAYLRYKRDAAGLEHDVHLFAFIADDFARVWSGSFLGALKPELVVEDDRLTVRRVPVPELSTARRLMRSTRSVARRFSAAELARRLVPSIRWPSCVWSDAGEGGDGVIRAVVGKVFESLRDLASERDAALALVYIPCVDEYGTGGSRWRKFAEEASSRLGIPFVDLLHDLNRVTREEMETLFIGGSAGGAPLLGDGHYTVGGHAFLARALHRRLRELEPMAARLHATRAVTP